MGILGGPIKGKIIPADGDSFRSLLFSVPKKYPLAIEYDYISETHPLVDKSLIASNDRGVV